MIKLFNPKLKYLTKSNPTKPNFSLDEVISVNTAFVSPLLIHDLNARIEVD